MFLTAFIGGCMIGLSAAILLVCNGDILGFSGIVSSVVLSFTSSPSCLQDSQQHWKLVFLTSFIVTSHFVIDPRYNSHEEQEHHNDSSSVLRHLVAGLLVGFGTQLGNGCTSGHGICGLSRFSPRSIVAVLTFMTSAVITTTIVMPNVTQIQQKESFKDVHDENSSVNTSELLSTMLVIVSMGAVIISSFIYKIPFVDVTARAKTIPAMITGILMSIGLYICEMIYPTNIINFLNVALIKDGTWDASLMVVMASGIFVSFLSYQIIQGYKIVSLGLINSKTIGHPILLGRKSKFNIPTNTIIDAHLVLGAIVFGIGWSIGGLCPAPAMVVAAGSNNNHVIQYWWPAYFVGAYMAREIKTKQTIQQPLAQRKVA